METGNTTKNAITTKRKHMMLSLGRNSLRVDILPDRYRLWIAANRDFTLGTFYDLYYNGEVEWTTTRGDEGDDTTTVCTTNIKT